jgi:AcrR family transcriptional regulator
VEITVTKATGKATESTRGVKVVNAERIVQAAVGICDRDGIESLTTRGLAAELKIGTMTLYGYFLSKEEILDGVADYVLGNFCLPVVTDATPAEVVRQIAEAWFEMMRQHPSVVHLLLSRVTTSRRSLKAAMEDVIGALRGAGFTDEGAVRAYALIVTYTLGFAGYQSPRPWGDDRRDDVDELRRQRSHFNASLPLPEFANLVELNELAADMASTEQFRFGLDCLIDGLVARAVPSRRGRGRSSLARRAGTSAGDRSDGRQDRL